MADIEPVAVEPSRRAADKSDAQHIEDDEKHEGLVAQAKEVLTGHHVTQVEHTKINEAIAQGIAANVDDFMVR